MSVEAKLLAGVIQTDTHLRLQAAEGLVEYFKDESHDPEDFPEFDRLVSGLAAWMGSSNAKISAGAMEILGILVHNTRDRFKQHIPTIFPTLKERLGDAKDGVREQAQLLIQQLMRQVITSPQIFLERLMEACLSHKNWRVKEQGLVSLTRTLNYFGSGQVSVSKFIGSICNLLGDANSQVRSCAVDTVVEIYRHVGVKVRIDLSRRGLSASRMATLTAKFDEIDAATGTVSEDIDMDDDSGSVGSCSSSTSAHTHTSHTSSRSTGARPTAGRPPSVARGNIGGSSSGVVDEAAFEKYFQDSPQVNIFTAQDLERTMSGIQTTLGDPNKEWEARVSALKELRSVAKLESLDHQHFLQLLRSLELPLNTSLKDLRSSVTREACVTLSYLSVVFGPDFSHCAEMVLPQLINLLPSSAKVMATSAEVCIKFIIKNTHTHRLLQPLSSVGLSSKSAVLRKYCAEFVSQALHTWSSHALERSCGLLEGLLKKGLVDADATARKHIRRAYWGYHAHFPSAADRLFNSLEPQQQKHLTDEKTAMERGGANGAMPPPSSSLRALAKKRPPPLSTSGSLDRATPTSPRSFMEPTQLQKALTSIANIYPLSNQQLSPLSPTHSSLSPTHSTLSPTHSFAPSIRLQRPTVRQSPTRTRRPVDKPLRSAQSIENLDDRRPQSRSGSRAGSRTGMRPSSRSGLSQKSGTSMLRASSAGRPRASPGMRLSRSAQPSPNTSRESSPTRYGGGGGTLPRKFESLSLTKEAMLRVYGGGSMDDDDDDRGSVTSERSTLSMASEISVSPYTKFPNPVTDLTELVAMCSSQQWSERRDGIAQLHMLLESSRPFSHADMQKVKAVFKRMFTEPHAKVYGMFLDTLSRYIDEHREYLDDWLFLLLLRLLHRQGMDMLSSVHFKLQLVLELVRKSFEADLQFSTLCRILMDQTQPMNNKVKLGWLEYLQELLPLLDSVEFKDVTETRQAVAKLLAMTSDPKSGEIRRCSQKAIIGLFDLNPATFTLMLRSVSKPLQESANRILRSYMQENASSGDEAEAPPPASPAPSGRRSRSGARTPMGSRIPAPSPSHTPTSSPRLRPKTPQGRARATPTQSLTPTSSKLKSSRSISASSPDMLELFSNGEPLTPTTPGYRPPSRSRIPTPSRRTPSTPSTPSSTPRTARRRVIPPRAQSVEPGRARRELMGGKSGRKEEGGERTEKAPKRPTSARSEYTPMRYQNGGRGEETPSELSPTSLEHFSFSDLPNLDFGSPEPEDGGDELTHDQTAMVMRELQTASTSKLRYAALQSLFTLSREFPDKCNWEEHFKSTLLKLVETMADEDPNVRTVSLRVLREIMKTQHDRLRDYAELTTMKILRAFADKDASVSQAAEDLFTLLAPAVPSESAIELLAPMVAKEKYPLLLGVIKLLTKVISLAEAGYLEGKLRETVPGVIRGYCHSESSVRKASVFCLVAIHSVVGEKLREHLTKLTSSQTKLLDLYIKRHLQQSGQLQSSQQNGPKR